MRYLDLEEAGQKGGLANGRLPHPTSVKTSRERIDAGWAACYTPFAASVDSCRFPRRLILKNSLALFSQKFPQNGKIELDLKS